MRTGLLLCAVILLAGAVGPATAAERLSRLRVIERQVGTGAVARDGSEVELNYTGWLYDANAPDHHGIEIDSSREHGKTISFTLGEGQVIPGWDRGIKGMHVGGRRILLIPSRLAYRGRRVGKLVPPNAALVFDIELVGVH